MTTLKQLQDFEEEANRQLDAWLAAGRPVTLHVPHWAKRCNPYLVDEMRCVECGGVRAEPYPTPFTPRGSIQEYK